MTHASLILSCLITFLGCVGLSMDMIAAFQTQTPAVEMLHWQCWTWLGTYVISVFVSVVNAIQLLCVKRLERTHHVLGIVCLIVSLVACILLDDKMPPIEHTSSETVLPFLSLYTHCSLFDAEHDAYYPVLYQRCMLMDSTWLVGIFVTLLWGSLSFIAFHEYLRGRKSGRSASGVFQSASSRVGRMRASKLEALPSTKVEQPLSMSSSFDTIAVSPQGAANAHHHHHTGDNGTLASTTAPCTPLTPFSYLPTKALPPLKRDSDDTLCLPIHTSHAPTYAIPCSPTSIDEPPAPSTRQSSMATAPSGLSVIEDYTSLMRPHDEKLELPGNWTTETHSSTEAFSRRNMIAQSCPEFNKKKLFKLPHFSSGTKDDVALQY